MLCRVVGKTELLLWVLTDVRKTGRWLMAASAQAFLLELGSAERSDEWIRNKGSEFLRQVLGKALSLLAESFL